MAEASGDSLRSLNADTVTYVTFANTTGRTVDLLWVDYKGKLVRYGHIPPRKSTSINTFETHPWVARDASTWYPVLFNGQHTFMPKAERNGTLFTNSNRDIISIHIPVYPLFRRCIEMAFHHFERETIANSNIPKELKNTILKMSPSTNYKNYKDFYLMRYSNCGSPDLSSDDDEEEEGEEEVEVEWDIDH